jgi:hypothetical protein
LIGHKIDDFFFLIFFSKLLAISFFKPGNLEKIFLNLLLIIVYKIVSRKKREKKSLGNSVYPKKIAVKVGKICPKNMISLGGYSFATKLIIKWDKFYLYPLLTNLQTI